MKVYISKNGDKGYCVADNGRVLFTGSVEDCNRKIEELSRAAKENGMNIH